MTVVVIVVHVAVVVIVEHLALVFFVVHVAVVIVVVFAALVNVVGVVVLAKNARVSWLSLLRMFWKLKSVPIKWTCVKRKSKPRMAYMLALLLLPYILARFELLSGSSVMNIAR